MLRDYSFQVNIFNDFLEEHFLLFSNFIENKFDLSYKFTIGVDIMAKTLELENGRLAKLSLWVMGNQDHFRRFIPDWLISSHGILIMCDITREREIIEIDTWLKDILSYIENLGRKIPIILVGYMTDDKKAKIPHEELRKFAKLYNLDKCEICNLQTGENIEEIFEIFIRDRIKFYR